MSILESVRKGFSFFLMSMGVSTYAKKPSAPVEVPDLPVVPTIKPE